MALAWGCSSDDETTASAPFVVSQAPHWAIDWTWNDPEPDWKEPPSTQYECRMELLVAMDDDLKRLSSEEDQMAIFINGTCRGISFPNVSKTTGNVFFLIHIKGTSQEVGADMELRYYCHNARQLFTDKYMPVFTPNNLMDEAHQQVFNLAGSSSKYPLFTQLAVTIPENVPFTVTEDDELAVFVGDECRGILHTTPEDYFRWCSVVVSREENETATIRYYSAEKQGIYTIAEGVQLNNDLQSVNARF